LSNNSANTGKT
jgi:hypothetical protein